MRNQLPLVFFAAAFFILLLGLYSKFTAQKARIPAISPSTVIVTPTSFIPSLNYNAPITCNFQDKTSSFAATMKGTDITVSYFADAQPTHTIVVRGDCVYQAVGKAPLVKTKCGVGNSVTMAKQLLSSGLLSPDMLTSVLKQSGKSIPFDVGKIMASCKNEK